MKFSDRLSCYAIIGLLLFFLTNISICSAQSLIFKASPKYEVRAVWLTTIGGLDWPHNYAQSKSSIEKQKKELTKILDKLKEANINTILFQTRIRGTVIYPSDIEPWDGCCSGIPGKSPGYDPLEFAVEECHKRGMEIHAWVVTIPVGKWNGLGCRAIRSKHTGLVVRNGTDGFINPASPTAAPYIAGICKEITKKYDIDGIHLDYIRYPETWKHGIAINNARENITQIVRTIHQRIKEIKPWVKLSCSPIGKYDDLCRYSSRGWNAYTKGCQDAQGWLKLGLMDQLYPMMYFKGNQFYPFALDWKESSCGRTIVPGLGIYFLSKDQADWPAEEIQRQMYTLRSNGMGYAFFRNKFFCDDIKGLYSFTQEVFNLHPALTPPMTWMKKDKPEAPSGINVVKTDQYEIVTWDKVRNNEDGGIMYNIYASKSYPVNIDDVRNLLVQRFTDNCLILNNSESDNIFYAVTSVDRYGNESIPVQMISDKISSHTYISIKNNGNKMLLPDKGQILDSEYILIKSLTDVIIAIRPYKGKYADISTLRNGCYTVYSLNHKEVTHRLGFLIIKR